MNVPANQAPPISNEQRQETTLGVTTPGDIRAPGSKVIELDINPTTQGTATAAIVPSDEQLTIADRMKELLIGKPRNLADQTVFHSLSLVAFLAWVGLGADGLSSACYGPAEAYHNLHGHTYLALFLALATIGTVLVISSCYTHIIEEFPSGGGGYQIGRASCSG